MPLRLVKIWNRGEKEYTEKFKGKEIVIAARSYVTMEHSEGAQFMGRYAPTEKNALGDYIRCKPLSLERIDPDSKEVFKGEVKCALCNQPFKDELDLKLHSEDAHAESMVEKETRELAKKRKSKENRLIFL